ncbi:hypothetical protein COF09_16350 [Bacillus toyonensis]|nr:hypothetical protein COF09_16350 [Bacillus toyonensis]
MLINKYVVFIKALTIANVEESKNMNIAYKKANLLKREACFFLIPPFRGDEQKPPLVNFISYVWYLLTARGAK